MKEISRFIKIVLLVSGITALIIGSCLLFIPVTFQASAGIELGNDPGLLSEMRGPGALILTSGMVMIAGAFVFEITLTALILSTLLYSAYGIARLLSLAVDGTPTPAIIAAMVAEFIIGITSASALARFRSKNMKRVVSQV
jgi:hypothetical protein